MDEGLSMIVKLFFGFGIPLLLAGHITVWNRWNTGIKILRLSAFFISILLLILIEPWLHGKATPILGERVSISVGWAILYGLFILVIIFSSGLLGEWATKNSSRIFKIPTGIFVGASVILFLRVCEGGYAPSRYFTLFLVGAVLVILIPGGIAYRSRPNDGTQNQRR